MGFLPRLSARGHIFAFACALLSLAPSAEAAPRRIVSLDYCADQYLLALADRNQIAALSKGAGREDSYYRARATGLRRIRPSLEEVLALHPDLVVRDWGGPWDAEAVYARFDVPVLALGGGTDFAAARAHVLSAARAFGQEARGRALVRDLDARLSRLAALPEPADNAVLYMSAGGAVAGDGVMLDAMIAAAGGRNIAEHQGWTVLPLERLTRMAPALVVLGFFDTGRVGVNAWSPSRHPVFQRALAQARTITASASVISCESWYAIDGAEAIAAALRAPS